MKSAPGRIAYIDGLRGIAVLSVVLFHVGVYNAAAIGKLAPAIGVALRDSAHGVDLFFVLSGFCLSYPALVRLHKEGRTGFRIPAFAARRLVRIVPPYYAAIAVLLVAGLVLLRSGLQLPQSMARDALSFGGVFSQITFSANKYLASSFWTLAIEFRWYFLFPLVLWLWTLSRPAFGLVAALALIASERLAHVPDLFFLPTFMLGIVAADIEVRGSRVARFAPFALPGLLAAAVAMTVHSGWYFLDVGPFWGIAMFGLVVAAGSSHLMKRVLSQKWLIFVGATSYGIYLVHEPAIELVQRMFPAALPLGVRLGLAAAAAVTIGVVFSVCAEQPFVRSALRDQLVAVAEDRISALVLSVKGFAKKTLRRDARHLELGAQGR